MSVWSIYQHPRLYRLAMRVSYRSEYRERYTLLAGHIAEPSHVIEVCCGDLVLYEHLCARGLLRSYRGLDSSPAMVGRARQRGVPVDAVDLRTARVLPRAQVVIMQASLYQFHTIAEALLCRLWDSAERQLLIAEPVRNLSTSANGVLRWVGQLLSRTDEGSHPFRYTEDRLRELYQRCGIPMTRLGRTTHGREMVISSVKPR